MREPIVPAALKSGDHVRVVAPADSLQPQIADHIIEQGVKRLNALGLKVSFGDHIREVDEFKSSSIESRISDLHEAFADPSVHAVFALTGGTSSNQLLKHLDYDLIRANPKIVCGLSDITVLVNAIYVKTGIVTFYGPNFLSVAASTDPTYTLDYLRKCLMSDEEFTLTPADYFYNTQWSEERIENSGYWIINEGQAEGTIVGGNFLTFNFIQGSEYVIKDQPMIYVLEDNGAESANNVQNQLQSLLLQPNAKNIQGILIGRFRKDSKMSSDLLTKIIKSKKELTNIPVIGNIDFGHTVPLVTLPIGGFAHISANDKQCKIKMRKRP